MVSALAIQRRLAAAVWPDGTTVRARIGVHSGRPTLTEEGYVGLDVHLAARIMAAAHGGQIVASSETTRQLGAEAIEGTIVRPLGRFALRGMPEPVDLFQLDPAGSPTSFPPLRALPG